MTPTQRTLLIIVAFLAFMVGSFIWFVATWDAAKEDPVTRLNGVPAKPHLLAENIPGHSTWLAEPPIHARPSGALT